MKQSMIKRVKQTIIMAIGVTMLLTIMSGCSNKNKGEDQNKSNGDTNVETTVTVAPIITVAPTAAAVEGDSSTTDNEIKAEDTYIDTDNENLGVLIFMGANLTDDEMAQRTQQVIDDYVTDDKATKEKIADDLFCYEFDGQEVYCIIPHYVGSVVTVQRAELSDEGTLDAKDTLETSEMPFVMQCNGSELHSNVIITIEFKEESITFSPYISLKDGNVTPIDMMEVIDLTLE